MNGRWFVLCAGLLATSVGAAWAAPAPGADNPHGTYAEECSMCHRADSWRPAVITKAFDHAKSGFRLQGAHATAACRACHVSLEFSATKLKTECVSCHQDIHRNEFGPDCSRCHTTRNFIDYARMRRAHSLTRFPLSGTHMVIDCGDCHLPAAQGHLQYVNTPTQCADCHLDDYQGTTNPDHEANGTPLDCLQCHRPVSWRPARFPNHDAQFFPISSGRHKGKWSACADCHTNQPTYTTFECIQCHAHDDPVDLQGKHNGVGGYQYNSQACYNCHPRGEAD